MEEGSRQMGQIEKGRGYSGSWSVEGGKGWI